MAIFDLPIWIKGLALIILIVLSLIFAIREEIQNIFAMITGAITIIIIILWVIGLI